MTGSGLPKNVDPVTIASPSITWRMGYQNPLYCYYYSILMIISTNIAVITILIITIVITIHIITIICILLQITHR